MKAPYGSRITTSIGTEIDQFDRIQISLTDSSGKSYSRFFEIEQILPSSSKETGTILELHCLGTEYHTQMAHFSRSSDVFSGIELRIVTSTPNI